MANEIDIPLSHSQIGQTQSHSPSIIKVREQEPEPLAEEYQKISLSASIDKAVNPFIDFYRVTEGNLVKTGGNGMWHILKTEETLPSAGKYSFSFTVAQSEINCVEVGIMPKEYTPLENKICEKSLGFHLANGKVHDTKGNKEKRTTAWRAVCEPTPKGQLGTIQLDVDVENQMVFWKFEGKVIAKSVLTNYLKGLPCVAFVSMVHVNDVVTIERLQNHQQSTIL